MDLNVKLVDIGKDVIMLSPAFPLSFVQAVFMTHRSQGGYRILPLLPDITLPRAAKTTPGQGTVRTH